MRPVVPPGKIPHRVANAKGETRRRAFEGGVKYALATAEKYAGRTLENLLGVAFYNGYIAGVKAERERLTGSKWKAPK